MGQAVFIGDGRDGAFQLRALQHRLHPFHGLAGGRVVEPQGGLPLQRMVVDPRYSAAGSSCGPCSRSPGRWWRSPPGSCPPPDPPATGCTAHNRDSDNKGRCRIPAPHPPHGWGHSCAPGRSRFLQIPARPPGRRYNPRGIIPAQRHMELIFQQLLLHSKAHRQRVAGQEGLGRSRYRRKLSRPSSQTVVSKRSARPPPAACRWLPSPRRKRSPGRRCCRPGARRG